MEKLIEVPEGWKWKHTIPIFRAYDENGEWIIEGIGGDAEPEDIFNTRLSVACIEDMKKQILAREIPLLRSHWDENGKGIRKAKWFEAMGEIVDMLITPSAQFFPRITLDKADKYAKKLFTAIQRGKKMGLSFGGGEVAVHNEQYRDGRTVKVFDKLDLWHFVPTTQPVYGRNLLSPLGFISRSLDWDSAETRTMESDEYKDGYEDREKVYAIFRAVKESKEQDQSSLEGDTPMTKEEMEALGGIFRSAIEGLPDKIAQTVKDGMKEVMREMNPAPQAPAPAPAAPAPAPAAPEPAPAPAAPEPAPAPAPAPAPPAPPAPATAAPDPEEITRSIKAMVQDSLTAMLPELKTALKGGSPAPDAAKTPADSAADVMREVQDVLAGKVQRKDVKNPEVLRTVDAMCVTALNSQLGTEPATFRARQ